MALSPTVVKPRRPACASFGVAPLLRRCAAAVSTVMLAGTLAACRPATPSQAPDEGLGPVAWYTGDALAARPISATGRAAKLVRLDVLFDLLDAARFADDPDAREQLWIGLGGTARGRGPEATRDASTRLLAEAIALDAQALDEDSRSFVGGVITLLTADLGLVGAADDLAIRTAAYREIAATGHPRAADNARWRLYDHVRGCLEAAVGAPQERRVEVAVHSLYVREDSLAAWLDDRAVHAQAPMPAPDALWALLLESRAPLATDPRWTGVVARRALTDAKLELAARTSLPAPRDPSWPIARAPQGTGRRDSLGPVVRIDDRLVTVDLGRSQAREAERGAPELVRGIEGALALDGRGLVLLVAPPMLPSPALNSLIRSLFDARVARIELAIREPRVPADSGDVIFQLPLEVLRETDQGPASGALRKARLHMHLSGRGARLAADGKWLDLRPGATELDAQLALLRRAYPRERMITIGLADDVLYQQLVDLLRAVIGGPQRRFEVAAWRPAAAAPPLEPVAKAIAAEERRLQRRAELGGDTARAALQQPFPLAAGDQPRLEALARQLLRCLPELETPLAPGERVLVALRFDEGRLAEVTAQKPRTRVPADRLAALQTCAETETRGFRLREHRDVIRSEVVLVAR